MSVGSRLRAARVGGGSTAVGVGRGTSGLDARVGGPEGRTRHALRHRTDRGASLMAADAWSVADPTLCDVCGREACEDHLPPDLQTAPRDPGALAAIRATELVYARPPLEIIEGIAWAGGVTLMVAESGVGKTCIGLDQAGAVSDGTAWHGRFVERGSVAYVTFEGDAIGLRVRAIVEHAARRMENVYIIRATEPLSPQITRNGESQ